MAEPRIVEGVGSAVGRSRSTGPSRAAALEAAMVAATEKCAEEGVTDPDIIRERKLAAYAAERKRLDSADAAGAEAKPSRK